MTLRHSAIAIAMGILAATPTASWAQASLTTPFEAPVPVAAPALVIPAETPIAIEVTEPLGSRTSNIGDTFGLRLAEPIIINGVTTVPAGAVGGGEVIDAKRAGFGGSQGRLIISARYLDIGGQRVRVHGMQLTATGADRGGAVLAVSMIPYAGIASLFINGGEIQIPAGARGTAKLGAEITVPAPIPSSPVEPTTTQQ